MEDLEALIDASGGSASLSGSSSGAVLALDATSQLRPKIEALFMYESPFIVDDSRAPMPDGLSSQISQFVSVGQRDEAVRLFFTEGMGIPTLGVTMMRWLMPGWSKMTGHGAHHTVRPCDIRRNSERQAIASTAMDGCECADHGHGRKQEQDISS